MCKCLVVLIFQFSHFHIFTFAVKNNVFIMFFDVFMDYVI